MSMLRGVKSELTVPVRAVFLQDGGKRDQIIDFEATFTKLKAKEFQEVMSRVESGEYSDEDILNLYLVGWGKLKGTDGEDVAYCEDALADALEYREYRKALIDGFMLVQLGRKQALAKN